MPLFFFVVVTRNARIEDIEGTDLPSLQDARDEAMKDARSLMSAAMREGRDISSRSIEIHNAEGEMLLAVPFSAAITPDD
jgi:hypothetical protein